jgi:2'-hydroxyisoflavone reductase
MTNVLILGGTGWLSGRVAEGWLARGAAVTCLARGGRPAPGGARLVVADRAQPDAYAGVSGEDWDEVVDISSMPEHVAQALAALAPGAAHWTYVSSLSVYAREDQVGADETAAVHEPLTPGEEYDYGRAKSAAEASVRSARGDRAAIIRPGLIVGPGDPTDRFGYWVGRFALADDGPVLAPTLEGLSSQVIDVDDLAAFIVARGAERWHGTVNATGESLSLGETLALARQTADHTGDLVEAEPQWLREHDVTYWMGPRSLPLWLPQDMPGFATRSIDAYRAAGGSLRGLRETLERTLADERRRGLDRERVSGLTRAEELALLAEL